METIEKLELLIEIEQAIQHFENRINDLVWSNHFGSGLEFMTIRLKNTHNIEILEMCIDRLNERFTKQLNTLK